ncbi:aminotransferase class V-fold PLP-dependent enzyme [Marinigracilibium pacificum]|uniref:Alanine--glyoxylate aminotransferase family protein n=1 Tax=Marinigracilibium pacificum TaxID=2729599 RepID=A0A848IU20_9BACT|nr:aminotransferase class V-fold PLP-dependent enzyme [Marinigracilibium pacificum]NMM47993.1 alanine--glyoxylate aminotransferase family protein [Marinigracilibium pacificum]
MLQLYFTPGPSAIYPTVNLHIKEALRKGYLSDSHRSATFKGIYKETEDNLRMLLGIPDNFSILFTSSANEIWERLVQNTVGKKSLHLVNGAFSKRFAEIAAEYGKETIIYNAEEGSVVSPDTIKADNEVELVAITHNETSTGVSQPIEDIISIRKKFPQALIAVDAVSSLPIVELPYDQIDSAYFSVQKCFGLPAGLGVWIVNDRCIKKAEELESKKIITGSYHKLLAMAKKAEDHQTIETPNVLGIYLLGKVVGDMLNKGIGQIRNETLYKAGVLYYGLQTHPLLNPFVKNEKLRSNTVCIFETNDKSIEIINFLKAKSMVIGSGYGSFKNNHIRIANFPATGKEQIEMLTDKLNDFQ